MRCCDPRKVCCEKSVDLKSVQGNVLKNVIKIKKSRGVIELTRLTGSAQISWESDIATEYVEGCKTRWKIFV